MVGIGKQWFEANNGSNYNERNFIPKFILKYTTVTITTATTKSCLHVISSTSFRTCLGNNKGVFGSQ